jgi:hypothetical protein
MFYIVILLCVTFCSFHECSEREITRIAFGSCNKQFLDQPLWKHIERFNPDLWIWLGRFIASLCVHCSMVGDAVYHDKQLFPFDAVSHGCNPTPEVMQRNYDSQLRNKDYQRLIAKVPVIGRSFLLFYFILFILFIYFFGDAS